MSGNSKILAEIQRCEEKIREISETEENKRRIAVWGQTNTTSDYFHAVPADKKKVPFVIELEREAYAKVLGYNIIEFYKDPYLHYLSGLRTQIFKFENFDDDTPVVKKQPVYESTAFEKCIFKAGQAVYTEHDAVANHEPLIKEREDLERMKYPDFYSSGCMPQTIEFYEKIRDVASDDFEIPFPQWARSPWGCAWQVRGMENLMIDYMEDPEWVIRLLDFLTESRIRWTKQKDRYLGTAPGHGNIYNDEVMAPIVSPDMYKTCILPSEVKLSEFYHGISYWHSCGDTTNLYSLINCIPNLEMVTVSAWSDIEKAGEQYSEKTALEVQLHNLRDVLRPDSEDTLSNRIRLIRDSTVNHKSFITACGLVFVDDYKYTMKKIHTLSETARKILD